MEPSAAEPQPILTTEDYWTYEQRYEIASAWWEAHGREGKFQENVVPKLARFVLEDGVPVAFLACDMSNSIGKAWLEGALTAPGMSPSHANRVLAFGEFAITEAIKSNYGLLQTFTSRAAARSLEQRGWTRTTEGVHLVKLIA